MEEPKISTLAGQNRSVWTAVGRALRGRCPNCGGAPLFKSYLEQVDGCDVCHTPWGEIRADDGPPWLTILIVGHLVAPVLVLLGRTGQLAQWWCGPVAGAAAVALALAILPRAKGFFIAMIWARQADGA